MLYIFEEKVKKLNENLNEEEMHILVEDISNSNLTIDQKIQLLSEIKPINTPKLLTYEGYLKFRDYMISQGEWED